MRDTIHKSLGKKVREDSELKFYKVMAAPVLMYESESWTLKPVSYTHLDVYKRQV